MSNGVDLLRAAIGTADLVNTVSPGFARESLEPEMGAGVDDLLRGLGDRYSGIVNGIDTELWDPATDTTLPATYSRDEMAGKAICRADLAARHGLDADGPIFGMVGRLDPQKGFDLVTGAAERLVAAGGRLIVLGTGAHGLVADLQALAARMPDRIVVLDRFDRDEARRIYAGADAFLMPSRFEPCGQGQMIALRYGTIPVVRRTGGLADTVFDADAQPDGNGFVFGPAEPAALLDAATRTIAAWHDRPRWSALIARGMVIDHSWDGPAAAVRGALRPWLVAAERRQLAQDRAQQRPEAVEVGALGAVRGALEDVDPIGTEDRAQLLDGRPGHEAAGIGVGGDEVERRGIGHHHPPACVDSGAATYPRRDRRPRSPAA